MSEPREKALWRLDQEWRALHAQVEAREDALDCDSGDFTDPADIAIRDAAVAAFKAFRELEG